MALSVSYFMQTLADVLMELQVEIMVFIFAFFAHAVLFGKYSIGGKAMPNDKVKDMANDARPSTFLDSPKQPSSTADATKSAAQQLKFVKQCGAENRLDEAFSTIRASPDKQTYLFNTLLDACVERSDLLGAERVMSAAGAAGAADAVTYNTVLKARLVLGSAAKAQETVREMKDAGLKPTCVTFNQLIDATIHSDVSATWRLIDEMKACKVKPNQITASILLKSVQPGSKASDIDRTIAVVDAMEGKMDEVLLSSVIEACVRTERIDLLAKQLKKFGSSQLIKPSSSTTFGSMIRAYGVLQDVPAAWVLWQRMRADGIVLTSITLGCMVETLVTNGEIEAAHGLVRQILSDEATRPLVNAVIYCSIIKSLCHMKLFDRTWQVYQEMIQEGLKPSRTVFNALLDACARCGKMRRASDILQDMCKYGCEPNLVTYSSIIKGYCLDKKIDAALALVEHMRVEKGIVPDEVTWNTLLDGCARQGLCERGMALLKDMLDTNVAPSNFTLSVVVKLLHRGRRLDEAFEVCEKLSQKFNFKLNTFVFNNLVHACVGSKDIPRALATFARMLREGSCRPDSRTYLLLLEGCTTQGKTRDVAGLLAAVCGLEECAHPLLKGIAASSMKATGGLPAAAVSEALVLLARRGDEQPEDKHLAVKLYGELRKQVPELRKDSVWQRLSSETNSRRA